MFKKLFIIGFILLIIGGIGAAIFGSDYVAGSKKERIAQNFADAEVDRIDVKGEIGTLTIKETKEDSITVEIYGPKEDKDVETTLEDRTLHIVTKKDDFFTIGFSMKETDRDITIHLPAKTYDEIIAENSVGSIILDGVHANVIDCTANVGEIFIQNTEGELRLQNDVGKIDIEQTSIKNPITAENNVGEIIIKVTEIPDNHYISAYSDIGSIRLFGEKRSSYKSGNGKMTVDLKTDIGDITLMN